MLAIVGDSQAERLQSAYITEEEVKNIVKYLKNAFRDDIRETIDGVGEALFGVENATDKLIQGTPQFRLFVNVLERMGNR